MEEEKVVETGLEAWEDEPLFPDSEEGTESAAAEGTESAAAEDEAADSSADEDANAPKAEDTPGAPPEPDYKALYEEQQERDNAAKFRAVYQEQLGLTGNESVARLIAQNECGGKTYPLEDTPSAPGQSSVDFRAALQEIQTLYPDATEMPADVMKAFAGGASLKDAYAAHRARTDAQTIEGLRREVAALKKNASNRAAAPVKGVTGDAPEKNDPFLEAFNAEW